MVSGVAQERKLQNRPYIDQRRFHYGFLFGLHMQDLELKNNGYIDPESGEQWYADVDNYGPGFSVGVLGEMRLNSYLALRLVPTMHFGQKHVSFHEQASGRDSTQNIKSTYISVPVDLKIAAPRYNNYRPYFIVGVNPMIDLTTKKQKALLMKPFDCYLEVGMGLRFLPAFLQADSRTEVLLRPVRHPAKKPQRPDRRFAAEIYQFIGRRLIQDDCPYALFRVIHSTGSISSTSVPT